METRYTRTAEDTGELEELRGTDGAGGTGAPDVLGKAPPEEVEPPEGPLEEEEGPPAPVVRLGAVVAFSTLASAVMIGGIFVGVVGPRFWAGVAGVLGIVAAVYVRKIANPVGMNVAIIAAVFGIGILLTVPAGSFADVVNLGPFLHEAVTQGDVLRPPVEFTLGWRAILGWLMAAIGFAAAWIAIELRRPALGLLIPLPIVGVGAISTPDDAKVLSGLVCLALFAVGLGLLSGIDTEGDGEQRSLAFELRRAARAFPLIGAIVVALYLLAQTGLLFPQPVFDPTQAAQKPKTVPLTEVEDRVLFTVDSSVSGPWRMGSLDVYDGEDWRLPAWAEARLAEVPEDGVVDPELQPGVRATFEIHDLESPVFPGLPNMVGIIAEGPKLAYDARTGNIRISEGIMQTGMQYTAVAARMPTVADLQAVDADPPEEISGVPAESFLEIPPPPPAVEELIDEAPDDSRWDTLDYVRRHVLETVVASGSGQPVSITPERVEDMLVGSQEASPFEIVAAQAMLARWVGVPARIGYGFDGGEEAEDGLVEIRPRHGASFLEVYFPRYKWLPIMGTPEQAAGTFAEITQDDRDMLAGDDIAVQLFVPHEVEPRGMLWRQIREILAVVLPIIAGMLAVYFLWPGVHKAWLRSRRRAWAYREGTAARIAVAYAEWRDLATDFGYRYESDTPLMFLDRVVPDGDHVELAWLATRTLWGDLRGDISEEDAAAAEELSRALRKRLAQAHPWSLRAIAAVSRLSLRHPYAASLWALSRTKAGSGHARTAA